MRPSFFDRREQMGTTRLLALVAALVVGSLAVGRLYERAYPLRPVDWQVNRQEAVDIATAAARDLGELPSQPYISTILATQESLELRLLKDMPGGTATTENDTDRRLLYLWRVTIFGEGRAVDAWSYLVELSLAGDVLTLLSRTPDGFRSADAPSEGELVSRASDFLTRMGHQLASYEAPTVRRVELEGHTESLVRFRTRDTTLGSGVEVAFAGPALRGMRSFVSEAAEQTDSHIARLERGSTLAQTSRFFVAFAFLPFVAVVFVRRYHRGVVGVQNGVRTFYLLMVAAALLVLLVARGVADGSSLSDISREQMTWLMAVVLLLVYFPALAGLTLMGTALGDSAARGLWRRRLAPFDAFLRLQWNNSTFARACLEGLVAGVWLAAALLLLAIVAPMVQGVAAFSYVLGLWWASATVPGVALVLVMLVYSLVYAGFGLLFLLPRAVDRWGMAFGAGLVALFAAAVFFPPLNLLPAWHGMVVALVGAAVAIQLFVRCNWLVAFLALWVSAVCLGALPLMQANDTSLQVQGWAAMLLVSAPAIYSLRFVQTGELYRYHYDDVPPHVRRIAERERQRVELETARRIQASILPRLPASLHGVQIAHHYTPASEVGGDFYDVLELSDGRLAIAVGDVAGHGVSSGLIMASIRSALAVQVSHSADVREVVEVLNGVVYGAGERRRLLATLCFCILDGRSGLLQWASAGHIYPYRLGRDGSLEALESTAYPLGVRRDPRVDLRETTLGGGDVLFLCSDGLVEARRYGGEEPFGFARLEEALRAQAGRSASTIRDAVLDRLERFLGPAGLDESVAEPELDDDLTMLVLRLEDEVSAASAGGTRG